MKKNVQIMIIVFFACLIMGIVDAVIMPGYAAKSAIKVALFLLLPIFYSAINRDISVKNVMIPNKKGFLTALVLGAGVYAVVLGAYLAFRNVFDFSALTSNLTAQTGVNKSNFIFTAIYISFVNSLLEEFFFRGFAFLNLKRVSQRKTAYIFSSVLFALYHIAMMIGWFGIPVLLITVVGLFIGGCIFNFLDEKYGNIYLSWLVHMFANFATNTIGFILFANSI